MTQRAVRQYLESLSRAGITHLPSIVPRAATTGRGQQTAKSDEEAVGAAATPPAPNSPAVPSATEPVASPPTPVAKVVASTPVPVAPTVPPVADAASSTDTKQQALGSVRDRVAACERCPELASTRRQTVFGVGNPDARIMFIGEAPGADEDRQGEPFVGKAGQTLNRIITACKMTREEIYICNILRCRPPGNRNPAPDEAANCREFLDEQISTVQPEYIVCWGSVAAKNLLNSTESIGRMRGRFYQYGDAKVLCTYHPSYLDRNPSAKKFTWADMKFLFADMGVQL